MSKISTKNILKKIFKSKKNNSVKKKVKNTKKIKFKKPKKIKKKNERKKIIKKS